MIDDDEGIVRFVKNGVRKRITDQKRGITVSVSSLNKALSNP